MRRTDVFLVKRKTSVLLLAESELLSKAVRGAEELWFHRGCVSRSRKAAAILESSFFTLSRGAALITMEFVVRILKFRITGIFLNSRGPLPEGPPGPRCWQS